MNHAAIDLGIQAPQEATIPESWRHAVETEESMASRPRPEFVRQICDIMNRQAGDDLPVSAFRALPDGTFPCGTSQYEKRATATMVPEWIPENCIQCNQCSFVCPHATIRPVLATEEAAAAPEGFIVREAIARKARNSGSSFPRKIATAAATAPKSARRNRKRSSCARSKKN